jgi:hypothetical protein
VDVFNADDRNHDTRNPGTLTIEGNTVQRQQHEGEGSGDYCLFRFGELYNGKAGIHVMLAKEVQTRILGNTLSFVPLPASDDPVSLVKGAVHEVQQSCSFWPEERTTAIRLQDVNDANILVEGNRATGFAVGVGATFMDGKTAWRVVGNDFGKAQAIAYDDTVANKPQTT